MLDVIPVVVGVETIGGVLSTVFPRNKIIPSSSHRVFAVPAAVENDANVAVLRVFEGVRPWAEHAIMCVTELALHGLDRSQRSFVTVTIAIDTQSLLLHVGAKWHGARHRRTNASVTMPLRQGSFDAMVEAIDRASETNDLDECVRAFLNGQRDHAAGQCPVDAIARGANITATTLREHAAAPVIEDAQFVVASQDVAHEGTSGGASMLLVLRNDSSTRHTHEAVVVLLDAGPSMRAPLRERVASSKLSGKRNDTAPKTRFDAAVSAVEGLLQQKLFFKPKDEVGIVVYGSEDTNNQLNEEQGSTEYENVSVLQSIDTPTLGVWEQLRRLEPARASANAKVDILDGLIVALDLLFRRTDGKKYDKRLLVITDAAAKITDAGDVDSVVQMIQSMGVKLQIVGIDFRHTTDEAKKEESGATSHATEAPTAAHDSASDATNVIKTENEKMLVSIAKEVDGEVNSVSKRMELLAQGMKKTVALTTKFRGSLEIGQDLGIPLFCYLKTKVATLPTLAKESQASFDKDTAGKVKMDRRYTSPQHPDEDVAPDQQVKAYRYGMEKVPFSSADVEFFKFQTEKSLKLLGFLAKEQLSLAKFVGGTDVFIAEPGKPEGAQCLAALVDAMLELDQVAIARFVARKNAAPKIVALIPHAPDASDSYYALWSQQLPFEEDLRTYEFAPLKTAKHRPSASQQAAADKLVESLSVRDDKADSVGACLNPVLWRFFHAVSDRAFEADAPLPPLPAYVETCLSMDEARKQRIGGVIQAFGDAFQLKEAVKTTHERKKKAFWSDVAAALPSLKDEPSAGGSTAMTASGAGAAAIDADHDSHDAFDDAGSDLDLDDLLDSGDVTSVGSMNPVADFEALVDMAKTQRAKLVTAVSGMEARIESFLTSSTSFHRKAVQCLMHFRARSAALHYAAQFNDFLTQLKSKVGGERSDAWRAVEREGVTLLSTDDDPSLSVTPAQARAFLYGEEHLDVNSAAASLPTQVEAMEQEDDMFAEFE